MRLPLLALVPLTAFLTTSIPAKPAWKPLFNGTSFKPDWRFAGDSAFWAIDPKDTSIVGYSPTTSTPKSLLMTVKGDYDQFTVKYAYRLKAGCSGFWFHTRETSVPGEVEGPQVEVKREGAELLEIGSIYTWPTPGWELQHSRAYSIKTAPKVDEYQQVILTVKKPYVYVNVNGSQAVGETDPAGIAAGAKAAWNYTNSTYANQTGSLALQVHKGYAIDVRFKNIMILEGCGDAASPNYDGAFVQGFAKQPAVYQDNATCNGTGLRPGAEGAPRQIGVPRRIGSGVELDVASPGPNALEIRSLAGSLVFSGSAPGAHIYRFSRRMEPGLYYARLSAHGTVESRRILVP
jgi:hypothetical protein